MSVGQGHDCLDRGLLWLLAHHLRRFTLLAKAGHSASTPPPAVNLALLYHFDSNKLRTTKRWTIYNISWCRTWVQQCMCEAEWRF